MPRNSSRHKKKETIFVIGFRHIMPLFVTAIVFSFFVNLLLFVIPLYMLQVYDRVITSRNETTLVGITLIAGFFILIYSVLEFCRSKILIRAGVLFDDKISAKVFNAIHRACLVEPGINHIQCLRDVDTIRDFLAGAGLIILCDAPWVPVFVVASFLLHPWFGYLALSGSAVILALTVLNDLATRMKLEDASRSSMLATQNAQSMFRNSQVLQAMGMVGNVRRMWSEHHDKVLGLQEAASDHASGIVASTKFCRMFLQIAILGAGAHLAINREISPGSMIAASIMVGRALLPIELVVGNWKGFLAFRAARDRIRKLFETAGEEPRRLSLPRPRSELIVSQLVATPPGLANSPVIRGVSFSAQAGEVLGIVGPSAAGKSSLARVIVGAWPIKAGDVRLDGSDLSHWDPEELGKFVGYLPQDVELFAGTVAQNIARFHKIEMDSVMSAARNADCLDLIKRLPEGFNTQIGEGGQALSGGQRQRIGLARALYGDPSLVLLDEPNANLDSAGEESLLKAIQNLKAMRAIVLIVTHKVNILSVSDKIMILDHGFVQAVGFRDEILKLLASPSGFQREFSPRSAAADTSISIATA